VPRSQNKAVDEAQAGPYSSYFNQILAFGNNTGGSETKIFRSTVGE
jgi:hypothetical protein